MNEAHRQNKRLRRIGKLQQRMAEAEARRERAKTNGDFKAATTIHDREVKPAAAIYNAALSSAGSMRRADA